MRKPCIQELFIIDQDDQAGRNQSDEVGNKYGWASKEYRNLWTSIRLKDSINLIKVEVIIQTSGWLGADEIGSQSNTTLFMALQHSNLKTQEKYLPLMRKAVTNGKAQPKHLALLEDRVALRQGKKQIYGSQVSMNNQTNEAFVMPLEDPDNVDTRRGLVGLPPLAICKCLGHKMGRQAVQERFAIYRGEIKKTLRNVIYDGLTRLGPLVPCVVVRSA